MGEHDQAVPHDEDAHQSIHDDGRTLRPLGINETPDLDSVAFSDAQLTPVLRYSGDKLISGLFTPTFGRSSQPSGSHCTVACSRSETLTSAKQALHQ